ncbi:CAP domain-containing protein [Haliangium sp.]|uniref:CAP domain-containing protein n=1 Tax=Haliangium sp. TaxID=2663208 RepID=UPI003D0B0BFD
MILVILVDLVVLASVGVGCGDDGGPGPDGDGGILDGRPTSPPSSAYCDPVADWPADRAALEAEVVELVNQIRAQGADCNSEGSFGPAGALTMDPALQCAARVHTLDMFERGYFDHVNPEGQQPWDRMEAAGYTWRSAGENIAGGRDSAQGVVDQWMASDGHCANIMGPDFVHIGVGVVPGGPLWTQVFGRPR